MDCSPPGSSVHGILQATILEWVAIPFSRGSSQPRDWTQVSSSLDTKGRKETVSIFLMFSSAIHMVPSLPTLEVCSPNFISFSSVQFSRSVVSDSATPWIAARQASLSIAYSRSLLKLMPIESVMPSSHLILCHPLLLLPPTPPSIRVFSNESTLRMRWPKYWSFSLSISPSNEHPGLISFRMLQSPQILICFFLFQEKHAY